MAYIFNSLDGKENCPKKHLHKSAVSCPVFSKLVSTSVIEKPIAANVECALTRLSGEIWGSLSRTRTLEAADLLTGGQPLHMLSQRCPDNIQPPLLHICSSWEHNEASLNQNKSIRNCIEPHSLLSPSHQS